MEKFVCIHGHFYQPPRENPWLEAVELQDSASPFHDWNERVTAECYAPNAHARFLNGEGRIERIVNNYSRISFNFGPTVLSWMKEKAPDVLAAIVEADRQSRERFSGHGSALAQCYNHIIMPLANLRDKRTQVRWGIADFESRFGRAPEGMWLPECGADNESLDVLAEFGIKFTILAPNQAARVRLLGTKDWQDVSGNRVDPSMPYLVKLPSGRSIVVFFYDGPIARAVAFEQLLTNGEGLANRLLNGLNDSRNWNQLVHIATDGESYGHHFRYGDMALAYALHSIAASKKAKLTIYAEYLEHNPPTQEAEIFQPSSWSCVHGVERWFKHCGCNSGGHPGWNQNWRQPLRAALDWLRDELSGRYEKKGREFLKDPWEARNDYINVILNRSPENVDAFFRRNATRELKDAALVNALRLLEMQRHAMLMYTSCGWFFDELSGPETVQVIQYAARAIQLANDLLGEDLEPGFLDVLGAAKSNIPPHEDGRAIYAKFAKPAIMTRESAGAHYAISSLFNSYPEETRIYSFTVRQHARELFTAGHARLALGRIQVSFETTRNSDLVSYAVLHSGDHNVNCSARLDGDVEAYNKLVAEMRTAFERADFTEIIRIMDRHFGQKHYSIKNLFRDEQRKVLMQILGATNDEILNTYRLITDRHAPLMRFLADLHTPPIKGLGVAMEVVLNSELQRQFEADKLDLERVRSLLAECAATKITLDGAVLAYAFKTHFDRLSDQMRKSPDNVETLQRLAEAADLLPQVPFDVNLWKPQNTFYALTIELLPEMHVRAGEGDEKAKEWVEKFRVLGGKLGFRVDEKPIENPA